VRNRALGRDDNQSFPPRHVDTPLGFEDKAP
jgi:hypothetical protein